MFGAKRGDLPPGWGGWVSDEPVHWGANWGAREAGREMRNCILEGCVLSVKHQKGYDVPWAGRYRALTQS